MPIARAVGALGAQLEQVVQEERAKVARVQTNEAEVALRLVRDQLLYDPTSGALTRQRTQATDAPKAFAEGFTREASRIAAGIKDPEARALFENRVRALQAEAETVVMRHVDQELDKAQVEYVDAITQDELAKVERMPMDAEAVDAALATATRLRRELLVDRGFAPKMVERDLAQLTSQARVRQIGALLQSNAVGSVDRALALYDEVKDGVTDPRQREQLDKVVGQVRMDREVNRLANEILAASDDPVVRNERIGQIADAAVRKNVRDIVRGEERAAKEAVDLSREQSFERLQTYVTQGGRLTDARVAADVANLSVSQRETLEKFTAAPTTDNAAWLEWYQLSLDPSKLAEMSESTFRSHWARLSTNHRDDAERAYREAKQTANGPESSRNYMTPQTIIARAMRQVGGIGPLVPLSQVPNEKQALVAEFERQAAIEMATERNAKGRDLTVPEMQAVVDRMQLQFVRETVTAGINLFMPSRPRVIRQLENVQAFQMTPSDTMGIFAGTARIRFDQIPQDSIPALRNTLEGSGVPITNDNIAALYTLQLFDSNDKIRTTQWLNRNRR